jgi:hypothetical protein
VEYLLTEKKEAIKREVIDKATMLSLLESLEKGAVGQFGLLKLSGLIIDVIFPTPSQYLSFPFEYTTMCELAAWRGKDAIVGNLIRAGADPSVSARVLQFNTGNSHINNSLSDLNEYSHLTEGGADSSGANNFQELVSEVGRLLADKNYPSLNRWALQALNKTCPQYAISSLESLIVRIRVCNVGDMLEPSRTLMELINEQTYTYHAIQSTTTHAHMTPDQRDVLSKLQPPYQVWIVSKIVKMRIDGGGGVEEGTSLVTPPTFCLSCQVRPALLKWAGKCNHKICEECVWQCLSTTNKLHSRASHDQSASTPPDDDDFNLSCGAADDGENNASNGGGDDEEEEVDNDDQSGDDEETEIREYRGYRLRCPHCSCLCEGDEDEVDDFFAECSTQQMFELKNASFHRFTKLPALPSMLTNKMKAKDRGKFRALSFSQVAGNFIGSVQSVRIKALFRSVRERGITKK